MEKVEKAKSAAKAVQPGKSSKADKKATPAKKAPSTVKKLATQFRPSSIKKEGSKRMISDAKIAKLQKMYESGKHPAQKLCDEFGISMATFFNYLKIKV